jgi:hypothetical protein
MPKFHLVEVPDARASSRWTIEQITPGERPIPVAFIGPKAEVEAEVLRLNAGGEIVEKLPSIMRGKTSRRKNLQPGESFDGLWVCP